MNDDVLRNIVQSGQQGLDVPMTAPALYIKYKIELESGLGDDQLTDNSSNMCLYSSGSLLP
jgi:hypothetical protein